MELCCAHTQLQVMGASWQEQQWFPKGSGDIRSDEWRAFQTEETAMPRPEGVTQQSMFRAQQSEQSKAQRRELGEAHKAGWLVIDYRMPVNPALVESVHLIH